VQHLLHVSPEERAILQARLQAELAELRQREHVYVAKRKELQELEAMFRKKMDARVQLETRYKEKGARNQQIIEELQRQIDESHSILENSGGENDDCQLKIEDKERSVAQKEGEIKEIREQVYQRA